MRKSKIILVETQSFMLHAIIRLAIQNYTFLPRTRGLPCVLLDMTFVCWRGLTVHFSLYSLGQSVREIMVEIRESKKYDSLV